MAKKTSSSKRWLAAYRKDYYVNKAKKENYRSRAVYKLLEVVEKQRLFKRGDKVLDLGAAPGSWSQLARQYVGETGQVIANDIIDMQAISAVQFIKGDFTQASICEQILAAVGAKFNVILSDMSPNMSGHLSVDIPNAFYLAECALTIAIDNLQKSGTFYSKLFQGEGFDDYINKCRRYFIRVRIIKPKASRSGNKEVYLLAERLK